MIYVLNRENNKLYGVYSDLRAAYKYITGDRENYLFLEESGMKYLSRITHVDGKCIYNNAIFWLSDLNPILNYYGDHEVLDFNGLPVSKDRFIVEMRNNINRITAIDGIAGEIAYDMEIGTEVIAIFREICINTEILRETGVSPMTIFVKLQTVLNMLTAGALREAVMALEAIKETDTDVFLTAERLQLFIDMLSAADDIQYSTEAGYYYDTPSENGAGDNDATE